MEEQPTSASTPWDQPARPAIPGKGFLAACGSAVFPGVGQWLAGDRPRGIAWACAMAAALVALWLAIAFVPWIMAAWALTIVCTAIFALSAANAFLRGQASVRPLLASPGRRYAAGVLLLGIALGLWAGVGELSAITLRAAGVRYLAITTQAMRPTLHPGDRVIARRVPNLRRWDIVTFRPPGRTDVFTQRIAGLPGEKVEIVDDQLRINDAAVSPPPGVGPYTSRTSYGPQTGCAGHPIRLGPGEYFLLGDNSAFAYDSRSFPDAAPNHQVGAIPRESILERVIAIDWPPGRMHEFK